MTAEVDNFLEHHGVAGMKWGKRKAVVSSSGGSKTPSYARAAAGGIFANGKDRYTDPKALKQRSTAGKLFAASVVANVGSTALRALAQGSNNPSVSAGAAVASKLLGAAGAGTALASVGAGVASVKTERDARSARG